MLPLAPRILSVARLCNDLLHAGAGGTHEVMADLDDRGVAQRRRIEEDILRVDPIGIHDDFFELGGHSLLATRIVSRINDAFGRRVSLLTLFEMPTIAELASFMAEHHVARR